MDTLSSSEKLQALLTAGLTTVEVARETGISQPTISRIATGRHAEPRERSVRAIDAYYAKIFGDSTCAVGDALGILNLLPPDRDQRVGGSRQGVARRKSSPGVGP